MKRAYLFLLLSGFVFNACGEDGYRYPNGEKCWGDDMCLSGYCSENGVCEDLSGYIANGSACTSNDQCASGNCFEGKVCRAPNWGGTSKIAVGGVCSKDGDCTSNHCVAGVCNKAGDSEVHTKNGDACTSNDQCASGNCYEGRVCRTRSWNGGAKLENGDACTSDSQCSSNLCSDNICIASGGSSASLTAKAENGDPCNSNLDCASGYCSHNLCKANSVVSASQANEKYCDALINSCGGKTYSSYNGCVETMAILRSASPECTLEWDQAYTCYASVACHELRAYDTPLTNGVYYAAPDVCETLVKKYNTCAGL